MSDNQPDLINGYAAIGAHLGITRKMAEARAHAGEIPTFRMGDGTTVYARRSSLDAFMAKGAATPPAEIATYDGIGAYLGISGGAANGRIMRGEIPTFRKKNDKTIYARRSDLDKHRATFVAACVLKREERERARKDAYEAQRVKDRAERRAQKEKAESNRAESGLLYGAQSIAAYLGLTARQVEHLASKGELPTFKMGRKVCANRSVLDAHLGASPAAAAEESPPRVAELVPTTGAAGAADLLYGTDAIAAYIGLGVRKVLHLHSIGALPTFRLGSRICARRADLDDRLASAAAGPESGPRRYSPRGAKGAGKKATSADVSSDVFSGAQWFSTLISLGGSIGVASGFSITIPIDPGGDTARMRHLGELLFNGLGSVKGRQAIHAAARGLMVALGSVLLEANEEFSGTTENSCDGD